MIPVVAAVGAFAAKEQTATDIYTASNHGVGHLPRNQGPGNKVNPPHTGVRVAIISRAALRVQCQSAPQVIHGPSLFLSSFPSTQYIPLLQGFASQSQPKPGVPSVLCCSASGTSCHSPRSTRPTKTHKPRLPILNRSRAWRQVFPIFVQKRLKCAALRATPSLHPPHFSTSLSLTKSKQNSKIRATPTSPQANHCFQLQAAFAVTSPFPRFQIPRPRHHLCRSASLQGHPTRKVTVITDKSSSVRRH